jgi:hypothetical protein
LLAICAVYATREQHSAVVFIPSSAVVEHMKAFILLVIGLVQRASHTLTFEAFFNFCLVSLKVLIPEFILC